MGQIVSPISSVQTTGGGGSGSGGTGLENVSYTPLATSITAHIPYVAGYSQYAFARGVINSNGTLTREATLGPTTFQQDSSGIIDMTLDGLTPGTTYYLRAFAFDGMSSPDW
jgi:hypothetical protein